MGLFDFLFGKKKENTTVVFGVEEILPNPNDSEEERFTLEMKSLLQI